ncbi:MAG: hypothetical protein IKR94_09365 [Bacteroidales bacterium]|nr:hypothetical protein [Bacteroidales bacterium]
MAEAYYYKACSYFLLDSLPDEVFILLKKAEHLVYDISDYDLKGKIYSAFAYANNTVGELEESLVYAKKELYCAEQFGCRHDIAYALISVSSSFRDLGQNDSAAYYVQLCQNLIDDVSDDDKAFFYILMGECFTGDSYAVAEDYYLKSLKYQKLPRSYTGLADIYLTHGDTLRWRQYCDSALNNAWCKLKIDIYSDMSKVYYGLGNIDGLKNSSDSAFASLKDYFNMQKENYALEIQKKFDFERQKTDYERKMHILWFVIACLIFIGAIVVLFYRHLVHKERLKNVELEKINSVAYAKIEERNSLLEEYNAHLDSLQKHNDALLERCDDANKIIATNNQAIAKLRQECDNLIAQTDSVLAEGKVVYDHIVASQSVSDYKDKYAACFYYFEKTYPEKLSIFDTYRDLTIENRIFIIADDGLEKTDGELSKIFGISQSTVRSRRSKLKERLS